MDTPEVLIIGPGAGEQFWSSTGLHVAGYGGIARLHLWISVESVVQL